MRKLKEIEEELRQVLKEYTPLRWKVDKLESELVSTRKKLERLTFRQWLWWHCLVLAYNIVALVAKDMYSRSVSPVLPARIEEANDRLRLAAYDMRKLNRVTRDDSTGD